MNYPAGYYVPHGSVMEITCHPGYTVLTSGECLCNDGMWTTTLECAKGGSHVDVRGCTCIFNLYFIKLTLLCHKDVVILVYKVMKQMFHVFINEINDFHENNSELNATLTI